MGVHFLCGCSFHKHCFTTYRESEKECPVCEKENAKILGRLNRPEKQLNAAQFGQRLTHASDGFSAMIDMLSRGEISLFQPTKEPEEPYEPDEFAFHHTPVASNKLLANRAKIAAKLKSQAVAQAQSASSFSGSVVQTDVELDRDFFRRESSTVSTDSTNPFGDSDKPELNPSVITDSNPFGDENNDSDEPNPFGDDDGDVGDSNPFGNDGDDDAPANPFGEEDAEDAFDETNPFA